MRSLALTLIVAAAALGSTQAQAQFANRSLGLSLGFMSIADPTVEWGVPLGLESTLYIESGWDATLRVPLMILNERVANQQIVATGGNLGIRYLFSEETLRPYLGAELVFLHIFRSQGATNLFGLAPSAGLDYFVSHSVSIGARGFVNFYLTLNEPIRIAPGGQVLVATYF